MFSDAASVIQAVECDWCQAAERYRWSARISREQASEALASHFQAKGEAIGSLTMLSSSDDAAPGPSKLFSASDGRRSRTVSAVELRRLMPGATLHSPFFTIRQECDDFVFSGRGHGHGVGVCQWGARGLALEQKDCYEILRHYYPGVRFVRVQPPAD